MRRQSRRVGAACLVAAVFFSMSASAWSSEQFPGAGPEDPAAVAEAISSMRDREVAWVGEPINPEGVGRTTLTGGTVDVPSSGGEGVTFTDSEGESVRIGLPEAAGSQEAEVLDGGTVVFPGEESASAVIVTDHGAQMLTEIADGAAPTRCSYEIDLQDDQHLELVDDGAVVVDGDGSVTLAAGSAWATDAEGRSVPTW
ncbi:hypothetical protein [Actinomyces wuliandei]|uniref:hypothetical protein n=1 Tax=Actinomyces wuliandei TaxID=2057743 RepID=UPI000FD7BE92|nr:hypothetical protein [Actinomyces wuliandei]